MFEWLEPPAGGLARLRGRIEAERRRRARVRRVAPVALAAAAAGLVGFVLWVHERPVEPAWTEPSPMLVALGLAPAQSEPLTIPAGRRGVLAAERVSLAPGRVVYYRVGFTVADPAATVE